MIVQYGCWDTLTKKFNHEHDPHKSTRKSVWRTYSTTPNNSKTWLWM